MRYVVMAAAVVLSITAARADGVKVPPDAFAPLPDQPVLAWPPSLLPAGPWELVEVRGGFKVYDARGRVVAFVAFGDASSKNEYLTRDEARAAAVAIANAGPHG